MGKEILELGYVENTEIKKKNTGIPVPFTDVDIENI